MYKVNIYNNFYELLLEITEYIKNNNDSVIYTYGIPKQMLVGWVIDDVAFMLKVNSIRLRKAFPPQDDISINTREIFTKLICTNDGRELIGKFINSVSQYDNVLLKLDKIHALQAFW